MEPERYITVHQAGFDDSDGEELHIRASAVIGVQVIRNSRYGTTALLIEGGEFRAVKEDPDTLLGMLRWRSGS